MRGWSCCSTPARSGRSARAVGDGVLSGSGRVQGRAVVAWAQDGAFKGGSLGAAGGETIARTIQRADALGRPGRRLPALGRRAAAGGRRGADRLRGDLPRPGPGDGADDQRRSAARAPAARPTRPRWATSWSWPADARDVPHRPEDHRARHARGRSRRPSSAGPKVHGRQRRLRTWSPATTSTPPSWSAELLTFLPDRVGGDGMPLRPAGRRARRAIRATCCPRATAASTTCARSPRGSSTAATLLELAPQLGAQPRRRLRAASRAAPVGDHRQPAQAPRRLPRRRVVAEGRLVRGPLRPLRPPARRARRHPRASCRARPRSTAGVLRHGASLLRAFGRATVPRITVTLRQAYGGAHIVMNSRDLGAILTLAWPGARIGVMGAPPGRRAGAPARDRGRRRRGALADAYEAEHLPVRVARRAGFVDEVVAPSRRATRIACVARAGR